MNYTHNHYSHDNHCPTHYEHRHRNYYNDPLYGRVWSYIPTISSRAVFWETSETNRRLPGSPAARLGRSLGFNSARISGQQYIPKLIGARSYGPL